MTIAVLREALADVPATIVIAEPGQEIGETIRYLRAPATGAVVLLLLGPAVLPLDRAMLLAATGPLAIELAPATRIGAIDIAPGAAPGEVAEAALFLARAVSTTGQVLTVAPDSWPDS